MKKIALALSVCALIACQNESKNTVHITGKVNNPLEETVSILSEDRSETYTDTLDSYSNFEIQFEINSPKYMNFKHGKETTAMYVKPGDKIQLSIDPNEFDETINYTGSNASNFLAKKYLLDEKINRRDLFSLPESDFLAQVADAERNMLDLLKLVVDDSFITEQEKSIWFQWANTKLNYKRYFEFLSKTSIELSDTYFDFVSDVNMNDTSLLENHESYAFLKAYVSSEISGENQMFKTLQFIDKNFESQKIKDTLSYDILKNFINNASLENIDLILAEFKSLHSDSSIYNELADLALDMTKFNPGQPAINFSYPDVNGNEVSLSDFKGSYVYVDVWATWCGPCKREIPHLLELEKEYHEKNIVFLSVSVDQDEDYEAWLNMLEEKEMGGVQLFASGWSQITQDYKINGIPRFMLFDTEGTIVNVRASRPSDPETRKLFDEIL